MADDLVAIIGNGKHIAFIEPEGCSVHGLVLYDGQKFVCEWVKSRICPSKE
jgi:hypothetical protein